MKSLVFRLLPSIFGLAVVGPIARAVDSPQATDAQSLLQVKSTGPDSRLISVDFAGGTFSDLLSAIAKSGNTSFNVVGEKSDLATELPPFSVRNAVPQSVAAALDQLIAARGLNLSNPSNLVSGVYVLSKRRPGQATEPVVFESFQLASFLEKQSIEDIVSAIRTAWELDPSHKVDALQLKFHPATKLLLVSGTPDALNIVRHVVWTLLGAPEKNPKDQKADATPPVPKQ